MRAIYPVLRKYCLVGIQGNRYLQVNGNKRRVPELSALGRRSFCVGSILPQAAAAAVVSQNEISVLLQLSIPTTTDTDQMWAVSSPPRMLPPAAGHCCTADKLPYAGASPGCLLTGTLPASHTHCFDFLRQIHLVLMLHTTALMALGIQAPHAVPVAKTRVPAGLW